MKKKVYSSNDIELWIRKRIAEIVSLDLDAVVGSATFEHFGIDSAQAISLVMDLEQWLELEDELPLDLLFEGTSIRQSAEQICTLVQEWTMQSSTARGSTP